MPTLRTKLATFAAVAAAGAGGAAISSAATTGTASPSGSGTAAARPPAHDPSQGGHTVGGRTETPLGGDVAAQVRAAALAQVPGTVERVETNVDVAAKVRAAALAKVPGTVERVETNVDSSAPYEAHIRKADGTEVEVQVDKDYGVAAVNAMGAHP